MKVLSLLQPWASLVVLGHKQIETRSWATRHRGALLIHASLGWTRQTSAVAAHEPFLSVLRAHSDKLTTTNKRWGLPFGAIIGMVHVEGVQPVEVIEGVAKGVWYLNGKLMDWPREKAFGDYSPGRYGWLLSNPVAFDEPIPAKGHLGLWNYEGPLPAGLR